MRIAFFVHSVDQVGGAEIATMRLALRFAARGHEVTVLTTNPLSQPRQHSIIDYANSIRVIRLPVWQRSPRIFRAMLKIQTMWALPVLLHGTDILHLRGLRPETVAIARFARRMDLRTVCVPMAGGAFGDAAIFSDRLAANSYDWVSALTEPMRQEVIRLGISPARTGLIPNGVDTRQFSPSGEQTKRPQVIYVGQFRPEKRINLLLDAWNQVQDISPKAKLTLVGGGELRASYQGRAEQAGLSVAFVPETDANGIVGHLRSSSIFVLPGISEGMSNALLEAMAVGLAPLVADTPANRAVITPEVNGLAYQADSAAALASSLVRLLRDPELRRRLGTAARQTVEQRYNLDTVVDQYLTLYTRLLGETR